MTEIPASRFTYSAPLPGDPWNVRIKPEDADDDAIVYYVHVTEDDGRPALTYYAETAANGGILPLDAPRIDRGALAVIALSFLRDQRVWESMGNELPTWALDRRKPADAALLRVIRWAIAQGKSPRQLLAARYGVKVATADDWLAYARKLPEAADLPPARRGRPRKPQTNPKESNR